MKLLKKHWKIVGPYLCLAVFTVLLLALGVAPRAYAANETFKWTAWDTVEASGGDFRNTVTFKSAGAILPNQPEQFQLQQVIDTSRSCVILPSTPSVYLFSNGAFALGGFDVGQDSTDGGRPTCIRQGGDSAAFVKTYNNTQITVQGQRPSRGNQPETEAQKKVNIFINTSDPAKAPASLNVKIINKANGQTALEGPVQKDANLGSYGFVATLDPGTYTLSANAIIQPVDFTKERFTPLLLNFGEADYQRRAIAIINMSFNGAGGQTYVIGPYDIQLQRPNGSFIATAVTGSKTYATQGDQTTTSTVDVKDLGGARFNDVSAGNYKMCIVALNKCQDFVKEADKAAIITFNLDVSEGTSLMSASQKSQFPKPIKQTCVGNDPLDWMFCSVLEAAIEGSRVVSDLLNSLLFVNPLTTEGSGKLAFETWQVIRSLANILLIIGMFVLIFSQATSVGLSAYGVKKALPKLVIVGIALNLSFFICAALVDAMNVAGRGITDLLESTLLNVGGQQAASLSSILQQATGTVLLVTTGVIIFALFWSAVLGGMLIGLLAIAARHGVIIILVIGSPIILTLWLLPNTEQQFKKCFAAFIGLLAVYPIIMLILAGSRVAATIIVNT